MSLCDEYVSKVKFCSLVTHSVCSALEQMSYFEKAAQTVRTDLESIRSKMDVFMF